MRFESAAGDWHGLRSDQACDTATSKAADFSLLLRTPFFPFKRPVFFSQRLYRATSDEHAVLRYRAAKGSGEKSAKHARRATWGMQGKLQNDCLHASDRRRFPLSACILLSFARKGQCSGVAASACIQYAHGMHWQWKISKRDKGPRQKARFECRLHAVWHGNARLRSGCAAADHRAGHLAASRPAGRAAQGACAETRSRGCPRLRAATK